MNTEHFYFTYPWVSFAHNHLYYRRFRIVRKAKAPIDKSKRYVIIVSNHQNSLNDAMGMVMAEKGTKVWFLARADVFKSKIAAFFLHAYGVLPIYRVRDGLSNVKNNLEIFDNVEQMALRHCPIALFPEAKHQNRRYLGNFHLSYTRLAFSIAERLDFKEDVYILPMANHYSDYFSLRPDLLMVVGEYISIKPYYELYKQNPRLAQNEVNEKVRTCVSQMMLDIQEEPHYQDIYDMLSNYGVTYAVNHGVQPCDMYQKLCSDKQIVAKLEAEKLHDAANFEHLCNLSHAYSEQLTKNKINDKSVRKVRGVLMLCLQLLLLSAFFPLALTGWLHHAIAYLIPKYLSRNMKDVLMRPSVDFAVTTVITLPLTYIFFAILYGCVFHSWWAALLSWPVLMLLGLSADEWMRAGKQWLSGMRVQGMKIKKPQQWQQLLQLRKQLADEMNVLMQR